MFINKNKYYIYIDNLSSINFNFIKIGEKLNFIYRNSAKKENLSKLIRFIKICKKKRIKFFISNNLSLAIKTKASGIYLSSHNNQLVKKEYRETKKFEIIGSAHNFKEINLKLKQGCEKVVLSRLFKTNYKNKTSYLGITKFNLIIRNYRNSFVALGGIRSTNLMKVKMLRCDGIALLSEPKKKPAIIRRLF
tara:strand:- start:804 stop:1379 length:576 start_codon:yes stop_codon:yes gene_type:complete